MSLSEREKNELISYRISQAEETIEEAGLLIDNNKLRAAVSRIYYGIFYSVMALALKHGFKTSKHQQLIGWFNKNFIHENIFDQRYGVILRKAYQYRVEGDYEPLSDFSKETVMSLFEDMKTFISRIKTYISDSV